MTYLDEIQIAGSSAEQLPGTGVVITVLPTPPLMDEATTSLSDFGKTVSPFAFPRNAHPSRLPRYDI